MNVLQVSFLFLIILCFNCPFLKASELMVDEAQKQLEIVPCDEDLDCKKYSNAKCVNSFCECNGSNLCPRVLEIKVTQLGMPCQSNSDCHIDNSVCNNNQCECREDLKPSADKRKCLQELMKSCSKPEDCPSIPHVACLKEKCTCTEGYVVNQESTECLEVAQNINDPCFEDAQCSSKLCVNGHCQSEKFNVVTNKCEPCIKDKCDGFTVKKEPQQCVPGKCECPEERQYCSSQANQPVPVQVLGLFSDFIVEVVRQYNASFGKGVAPKFTIKVHSPPAHGTSDTTSKNTNESFFDGSLRGTLAVILTIAFCFMNCLPPDMLDIFCRYVYFCAWLLFVSLFLDYIGLDPIASASSCIMGYLTLIYGITVAYLRLR